MNKNSPLNGLLSRSTLFNQFDEDDRAKLAELATCRQLKTSEYLTHQGDYWPKLIYIESGVLKWVMLSETGKEHVFFPIESGSVFWGHTIFDDLPMPASLVAKKPSIVYSWNKEIIKPIISRYPDIMWEIGKSLVGIMRRNREVVVNLAFRQMTGRLAKILLDLSNEDSELIERDFTLTDMATMAATSQEVICRILYEFQDQDILEITRAQIKIKDRVTLQDLINKA